MARRPDRAAALLQQLQQADEEGDVYTSLTVIKTFCSRLCNKGSHDKAATMLASGAQTVLGKAHIEPGYELAMDLLKLHSGQGWEATSSRLERLANVCNAFPPCARQLKFTRAAIDWSKKCPGPGSTAQDTGYGASVLHAIAAASSVQQDLRADALEHFPFANNRSAFASAVVSWSMAAAPSERDLFIARAVFVALTLGSLAAANSVFEDWCAQMSGSTAQAPSDDISPIRPPPASPVDTPLVHFVGFLLLTLQRPAGPLLGLLVRKYNTALRRDAEFHRLVFSVASRFYGAAAAQQIFNQNTAAAGGGSGNQAVAATNRGVPATVSSIGNEGFFGMGAGMPAGFLDMARSLQASQGGAASRGGGGAKVETLD